MASIQYWLWLANLKGISNQAKLGLLSYFGTPEQLYFADRAERALAPGMTKGCLEALERPSLEAANRILGDCQRLGLRIITLHDTDYPDRLRNIFDPPILLYVQGKMPVFDDEVAIAMVGTRECSQYGERVAERLGYELAKQGALVVSGLARGLDAMSHRGALRAGGMTAAVIGGGHDIHYPRENDRLYRDIAATGVILSEYPPGTRHLGAHFPVRNRILSGLCLGTVVIEAPARSGALITAHAALEQGRDVFAVPGPVDAENSQGTNRLIQEGAIPALNAAAILREYEGRYPHKLHLRPVRIPEPLGEGLQQPPAEPVGEAAEPVGEPAQEPKGEPEAAANQAPVLDLRQDHGYTDDQIAILRALGEGTMQVDDIIEAAQVPTRRTLSALTVLELDGLVRQESGKRYTLLVTVTG